MTLYAVFKQQRMVEPAFPTRELAEQVAAAYGYGYRVVPIDVNLEDGE
jgi:hypothetical protein